MAKVKSEELREKVTRLADDAKTKLGDATTDVRKGAERATEEIRKGYERAYSAAREGYDDASKNLRKGYKRVRKDFDSLSSDMNEYVQDNPGKSILIAAGIGFLFGLLVRGGGDRE